MRHAVARKRSQPRTGRSGRPRSTPALRLGELRALDWEHVDLGRGNDHASSVVTTRRPVTWSRRVVPAAVASRCASVLREALIDHQLLTEPRQPASSSVGLPTRPLAPARSTCARARAWSAAGLEPIGLHECRHTCASYFIAAGINAKTLSTFLGHASITTTLDRYGHLFRDRRPRQRASSMLTWRGPTPRSRIAQLGSGNLRLRPGEQLVERPVACAVERNGRESAEWPLRTSPARLIRSLLGSILGRCTGLGGRDLRKGARPVRASRAPVRAVSSGLLRTAIGGGRGCRQVENRPQTVGFWLL